MGLNVGLKSSPLGEKPLGNVSMLVADSLSEPSVPSVPSEFSVSSEPSVLSVWAKAKLVDSTAKISRKVFLMLISFVLKCKVTKLFLIHNS